ncbi:MAG: DUF5071 domain-containing protein [Pseudomonadota bacterium]
MTPISKSDKEAVAALQLAPDNEVLDNAEKLLLWLQDVNWPIFEDVVSRLSFLGMELHENILKILEGDDSIWKADIVGHLIPRFSKSAQTKYISALQDMLKSPSNNDFQEGLIDFIEIQLSKNG